MADFDDNPFADPGAQGGINPFAVSVLALKGGGVE